jgi:hypothetical protein
MQPCAWPSIRQPSSACTLRPNFTLLQQPAAVGLDLQFFSAILGSCRSRPISCEVSRVDICIPPTLNPPSFLPSLSIAIALAFEISDFQLPSLPAQPQVCTYRPPIPSVSFCRHRRNRRDAKPTLPHQTPAQRPLRPLEPPGLDLRPHHSPRHSA